MFSTLQSTSLIRGKTVLRQTLLLLIQHFNPLPSSEGRHDPPGKLRRRYDFNPLPSSEGRLGMYMGLFFLPVLQSTSLIRGKTIPSSLTISAGRHFNPLPSSEGRPDALKKYSPIFALQSTSLIRGKTYLMEVPSNG